MSCDLYSGFIFFLVAIYAKIRNSTTSIKCPDPAQAIGGIILENLTSDEFEDGVALLGGDIVEWNTPVHVLSGLAGFEKCLEVISTIREFGMHAHFRR